MLWVNWIPEILIIVLILFALFSHALRGIGTIFVPAVVSLCSFAALIYFWMRNEGFSNQSPYLAFHLDALSYYGRSIGLLWLGMGSLYLIFHREVSMKNKLRMATIFVFFGAFFDTLFLAKSSLMYLLSWLGCFISLNYLISIESNQASLRSALLRQNSVAMVVIGMIGALFGFFNESKVLIILSGWAISFGFPIGLVLIQSFLARAPLSQAWTMLWIYFAAGVFWFRFGIPVLAESKEILGIIFSLTAIHAAVVAMRTKSSAIWLGSALFSVVNFFWLALLLEPEKSTSLFCGAGLAFVPIFTFSGFAFNQGAPFRKKAKVITALVLVAVLPMVTSDLYFSLIQSLIETKYLVFAVVAMLVWLLMCVSAIQQVGQLLTEKKSQEIDSIQNSILLIVFLACVIGLTFLKQPLLQLLNHHSLS